MRFLVILFIIIFSPVMAQDEALNCSDVSIATEHMPQNNNMNAHDWCVFWTTADLYSFYEQTPLSSYDLGLQFFNHPEVERDASIDDVTQVGANITEALKMAKAGKGICLEEQTNFTDSDWVALANVFYNISNPHKKLTQVICENNYQELAPFKNLPYSIIKILDKLSSDKKAAAFLDVTCGKRHQIKNKYSVGKRAIETSSPKKIIEKMDQLLSSNNPVAVSYNWEFVTAGVSFKKLDPDAPDHVSTVVGRRINPKTLKCEYQIRNTAGNRCPKSNLYECDKSTGRIWLPREDLQLHTYEVNWLQKI
jgi:hypothetical protein